MGWIEKAACRGHADPEIFFRKDDVLEALEICAGCPVQIDCLELQRGDAGVWGGVPFYGRGNARGERAVKQLPPIVENTRGATCEMCGARWRIAHARPKDLGLSGRVCPNCLAS